MKILGIGTRVEVRGVPATVESITKHGTIVLKSYDPRYGGAGGSHAVEHASVKFEEVNKMIDEKTLKIL